MLPVSPHDYCAGRFWPSQLGANRAGQTVSLTNHEPAILLVNCPDQKGLVAAITEFIAKNGGNVLSLEQHVDTHTNQFFMRVEWSLDEFAIPNEKIAEVFSRLDR